MGMSASADESYFQDEWDAKGLIGVEVGYMGTEYKEVRTKNGVPVEDINDNPIIDKKTTSSPSIGLKLGGESKHYRAFVEGRLWTTGNDNYKTGATVGAALQYLVRLNNQFNIFLGINGGVANSLDAQWDPYAGGDVGVNIDFSETYGIEIGGRYSAVDVNSDDYGKINSFYQGYVTAIFKFTGDY